MLLRKEININKLSDSTIELDLLSVASYDYFKDTNKVEVRVEHNTDINLHEGEQVSVTNVIQRNDALYGRYDINVSENYDIVECDNQAKTFSIIADKFQNLNLEGVMVEVEANVMYIHFVFGDWHYFGSWENHGIDFMVDYLETTIFFTGCEYVSDNELRWRYDANKEGIDNFMCYVFRNDTYKCTGYADEDSDGLDDYAIVDSIPETACFTDEVYLRRRVVLSKTPECIKWELYEKDCNDGTVFGLSAYRLSYKFKGVNSVWVYVTLPLASIEFPLSSVTGNDTFFEQGINENFVTHQVNKAKNKFTEMEKYIYHPVFKVYENMEYVYKPIRVIKFNLHFRQRDEEGWIVKDDGLWNGMSENGLYGDVTQTNVVKFFSYMPNSSNWTLDRGRQSDLLCYLGFGNSDVKYQKSKLKKSFLRLSFYDSPNRANQNLLSYSTIFLDAGTIFSRMMKGSNRKGLYVHSGSEFNTTFNDIKVDTEPCFENHNYLDVNTIEQFRLSSQIVVGDRLSESCSDGFYLYLWADNDNGSVPSDVYMRVEFNHAGYGRVVPMTMPYLYGTNDDKIYTMEEIAGIWARNNPNRGWGIRANEKFSYIHFKYVYDSEAKMHVYYLDPDTYGFGGYYDSSVPDELNLNLYEPKINFN
jgi:hypothetical protein